MSNPQQPELARSNHDVGGDAPPGPVPPENQPGHHPAEEQDKPPIDKFAARLGTMEPSERDAVLADDGRSEPAPAARRNALAGVAAVAALVAVVLAVLAGRRRRSGR